MEADARDAERQIGQAQGAATDIEDQLEDVRERFNSPHVEALQRVARDLAGDLQAAQAQARRMDSIARQAIVEAGEETKE